jgi:hypothetical protein
MTNTPAREGMPELPEADVLTCYFHRDTVAADRETCYDAGYRAAYIASQPTQGGEVSQELRDAWDARLYNVPAAQALAPLLAPGYRLIYRDAFRWKDANGSVLSNHYEWFNAAGLAADFGYAIAADLGFAAVIRDAALPHPQPARGEAVACETCGGRGEVGGWSPGDGYDAELCPDCTTPSPPSDAAQGDMVLVPGWFLRQVFGMAREGCKAPNAAYRWCERIDALFFTPNHREEYRSWELALPDAMHAARPVRVDDLIAKLSTDTHSVEIYSGRNHGGKNEWLVAIRDSRTDAANEYEGDTLLDALLAAHKGEGNG